MIVTPMPVKFGTQFDKTGPAAGGGLEQNVYVFGNIMHTRGCSRISGVPTVVLGGATGMTVKLQSRKNGGTWMDIMTQRDDTGAQATEHALVAGTVHLETTNTPLLDETRWAVKATGGVTTGVDRVTIDTDAEAT